MRIETRNMVPDAGLDRTLYLTEKKGLIVRRDGPSVWIKEEGSAGRRIPARLVNMVVVIGNILLDTGVVALFSENNVPIMFMNVKCQEVAVAAPSGGEKPDYGNIQRFFLESTDRVSAYISWARSKRRRIRHLVRSSCAEQKEGPLAMVWPGVAEMEKTIAYARREDPLVFTTAFDIIDDLARDMIIGMLQKTCLDPHAGILHRNARFGFARDICFMVEAETEAQAAAFAFSAREEHFLVSGPKSRIPSREGMKKIIEAFEGRKAALTRYVGDVLSSYVRFARRVA